VGTVRTGRLSECGELEFRSNGATNVFVDSGITARIADVQLVPILVSKQH
jgi:hypothetical protein